MKSKTDRILPFPSCGKLTPSKVFPPPLKDPPISCALTYSRLRQRIWGEGGLQKVVERASGGAKFCPFSLSSPHWKRVSLPQAKAKAKACSQCACKGDINLMRGEGRNGRFDCTTDGFS